MLNLQFKNALEFEAMFDPRTPKKEIQDAILQSIEDALHLGKKSAHVFEISFEGIVDGSYKVTLPKSQWIQSLEACKMFYEQTNDYNYAIDSYILIKKIRQSDADEIVNFKTK